MDINTMFSADNQRAALSFVEVQAAHIEREVYRIRYADVQYPELTPVDTSAHPFALAVTYSSIDGRGQARWTSGLGDDIPTVGTAMKDYVTPIYMASIGYDWGLEEIGQAQMMGYNLTGDKAMYARRAYEEFVDNIALIGDTVKGFNGLFDYPDINRVDAPDGAAGTPGWATKTGDEILADVNNHITGVMVATNTIALPDTLLIPYTAFNLIATRRLGDTTITVHDFLAQKNVYTAQTGNPLLIRGIRGLDAAGVGGTTRMIAYRRSPDVMKLHIPMPLRFLPPQQVGLRYMVPGIFRLGGLDIRLPSEVRYMDGI